MSKENIEVAEILKDENVKEIVIRHDNPKVINEQTVIDIRGNIDSVTRYLKSRIETLKASSLLKKCHILVDREAMTITLKVNEREHNFGTISGGLVVHPDFEKWNVNSEKKWDNKKLSDFILMNRGCFENEASATVLATELKNLSVKVNKEVEKHDNNRGDFKVQVAQTVISNNIPAGFDMKVPLFKGGDRSFFHVEIRVCPESFMVTLFSPEAQDAIYKVKNEAIDGELAEIAKGDGADILVLEQ